jgi:hypothetical protein
MKTHVAMLSAALASLAPAIALACPYCASRPGGGVGQSVAIGFFIAVPFVVAAVVYRFIRSGEPSSPARTQLGGEPSVRRS